VDRIFSTQDASAQSRSRHSGDSRHDALHVFDGRVRFRSSRFRLARGTQAGRGLDGCRNYRLCFGATRRTGIGCADDEEVGLEEIRHGESLATGLLKNRVSDNVGAVNHFLSVLRRALRRARHFALVESSCSCFCSTNQGSLVICFQVRTISPTHASLRSNVRS
jgi:hypothetical protein